MDELSKRLAGPRADPFKQVAGTGKAQISFKHVELTGRPATPPRTPT
jgi:DNA polymerase-1